MEGGNCGGEAEWRERMVEGRADVGMVVKRVGGMTGWFWNCGEEWRRREAMQSEGLVEGRDGEGQGGYWRNDRKAIN